MNKCYLKTRILLSARDSKRNADDFCYLLCCSEHNFVTVYQKILTFLRKLHGFAKYDIYSLVLFPSMLHATDLLLKT